MSVPVIVLREGTEQKKKREARQANINAMLAIKEAIESTMGPKGMDKMLVDSLGDITITNDGAEILDKLDIENAAALMMVNLAKSIDDEVGDGTTSAVVFTGKLLENALELIEQDIHPKPITHGFKLASDKAIQIIDEIAEKITEEDEQVLLNAAITSMNSKDIAAVKDYFAKLALKAVKYVAQNHEGEKIFGKVENIKIIKAPGKSLKDSELINGVYIDKERVNSQMPEVVQNAKIAVIRKKLEVVKGEYDSEIQISSPQDIQRFLDQENKMLKDYLKYFKDLGVNMIVNSQDISDKFGAILAKEGISAIKNLGESDLKLVLNATDATMVDDIKSLTEADLGFAEKVKFEKMGDDNYTLFSGCKNPKAVAIVLKGGLDKIISTAEIALHDVVSIIAKIMDTKTVVAGGGAINVEIAKRLRNYANEISGKEQLAIQSFALALEEIPATLIRNAGLDVVEKMTELKAAHKAPEDKWMGVDTIKNTIQDNMKNGIVEPAELIRHIVKSGAELSNLILRVDRIINAKGSKEE
jgi:thermosome